MERSEGIDQIPDEELVAQAQKNSAEPMAALITRYTPLTFQQTLAYQGMGMETEDLVQEGMLGLLSAIRTYRPAGGSSFRTYARHCIGNRIRSAVRAFHRNKNRPMAGYTPLEELPEKKLASGEEVDPQELLIRQEEQQQRQQQITALLSGFEQKVLQLHLGGYSYQQIAGHLVCTTKAVDNALQRVRRKLNTAE